ncbi:MAG TPA: hypothetical protein VL856_07200 [Acidimicrobiia bacterium]|jgi:hypothetical protein|nr:hypothetical protein [Acidimicrobiia bacterium]
MSEPMHETMRQEAFAEHRLRRRDLGWECTACGGRIEVPSGARIQEVVRASAGRPTELVIVANGVELHSCAVRPYC